MVDQDMADNFFLRKCPFHDPTDPIPAQETTVDASRLRSKFRISPLSPPGSTGIRISKRTWQVIYYEGGWGGWPIWKMKCVSEKGLGLSGEKEVRIMMAGVRIKATILTPSPGLGVFSALPEGAESTAGYFYPFPLALLSYFVTGLGAGGPVYRKEREP